MAAAPGSLARLHSTVSEDLKELYSRAYCMVARSCILGWNRERAVGERKRESWRRLVAELVAASLPPSIHPSMASIFGVTPCHMQQLDLS